jgi:hypothetical protein
MRTITKIITVNSLLILLSGCAGMMADSFTKSVITGKTYSELAPLPTPINSDGRVYIYRTEDSTKSSIQYGAGIRKNHMYCAVDDQVYYLLWEAFTYQDLTSGEHEVSCGDVYKNTEMFTPRNKRYQRGTQKLQVLVRKNEALYVRIDLLDNKETPVLVDADIAKSEISNLPIIKSRVSEGRIE